MSPVIHVKKLGPPIQMKNFNKIVASYPVDIKPEPSPSSPDPAGRADSDLPCSCSCALHPTEEEGSLELRWPFSFYEAGENIEYPDIHLELRAIDELAYQLDVEKQALDQKAQELEGRRNALRNHMASRSQRRIHRFERSHSMGDEQMKPRIEVTKDMD